MAQDGQIDVALNCGLTVTVWGPCGHFCHLRLIHPARNRLPRDFIS